MSNHLTKERFIYIPSSHVNKEKKLSNKIDKKQNQELKSLLHIFNPIDPLGEQCQILVLAIKAVIIFYVIYIV